MNHNSALLAALAAIMISTPLFSAEKRVRDASNRVPDELKSGRSSSFLSPKGASDPELLHLFVYRDNGTVVLPGETLQFNGTIPDLYWTAKTHIVTQSCTSYSLEYQISGPDGSYSTNSTNHVTQTSPVCPVTQQCNSMAPPSGTPDMFVRQLATSGRIYNLRVRAKINAYWNVVDADNGNWSCGSYIGSGTTDWKEYDPGRVGFRVPENWQDAWLPPLDWASVSGRQLDELDRLGGLIPDDQGVRYVSSESAPYRADFGILAARVSDPSRVSDGTYGIRVKSSKLCRMKLSAARIGEVGRVEWVELTTQDISSQYSWVLAKLPTDLRRYLIFSDGTNAQMRLAFACEGSSAFQLEFDVMGMSAKEMR